MDRCYMMRDLEELVVPNYQETSDSYTSSDIWSGWNIINTQKAAEKCFDFDVINNGFSGGLYSEMDMEMGTSGEAVVVKEEEEEEEEESKRFKEDGDCFISSALSLQDFDGIQQMDDMFLSSILEDVPGNTNLDSSKKLDNDNILDTLDGREVPLFHYNWESSCQDIPFMGEEELVKISDLCEEKKMEELSTEEVVLQDLQRATEKLTDETRKCFRDTFYRLAKNAQQKSDSSNTNSEEFLENRTRNISQKTELETNSIDRVIANLTFNKMESNMRNLPLPNRVCSSQG